MKPPKLFTPRSRGITQYHGEDHLVYLRRFCRKERKWKAREFSMAKGEILQRRRVWKYHLPAAGCLTGSASSPLLQGRNKSGWFETCLDNQNLVRLPLQDPSCPSHDLQAKPTLQISPLPCTHQATLTPFPEKRGKLTMNLASGAASVHAVSVLLILCCPC